LLYVSMKRKATEEPETHNDTKDSHKNNYLKIIGLSHIKGVAKNNIVFNSFLLDLPTSSSLELIQALYTYRVPKSDGACSRTKEKEADLPLFNLATEVYGVPLTEALLVHPLTVKIYRLSQIVKDLAALTESDWLGIYKIHPYANGKAGIAAIGDKKGEKALVKEAYIGETSRAIFPLTEEFAKQSNNSYVGIYKIARVVKDVEGYEGPYYECSSKVKSEFCVPIVTPYGKVVGIIDAESWTKEHYTDERIAEISKVAQDLAFVL